MSVRLYKSDSFSAKYQFLRRMNCNSHSRVKPPRIATPVFDPFSSPLFFSLPCCSLLLYRLFISISFAESAAHCREIGSVARLKWDRRLASVSVKIGHCYLVFTYVFFPTLSHLFFFFLYRPLFLRTPVWRVFREPRRTEKHRRLFRSVVCARLFNFRLCFREQPNRNLESHIRNILAVLYA